jgi:purine-nucleoside phosphorylase
MTTSHSNDAARQVARILRERGADVPQIALILGSGLGEIVQDVDAPTIVPYGDIPGFTDIRVRGHAGQLVLGTLAGVPVAIFAGRFHLYEGHPAPRVAFPVRIAHALGARTLVVANAAGGIDPAFLPGDFMVIADHLNLTGTSPLLGPEDEGDIRFPDMSAAYDPALRASLRTAGESLGFPMQEGVYAGLLGPSYETPAEIRMLRTVGASAVGMSTIPEVIAARALDMRVAGVSCITNMASGLQGNPLDHASVLSAAARVSEQFRALVRGALAMPAFSANP